MMLMLIRMMMAMGDGVGVRSLLCEPFCLQISSGKGWLQGFVWEMEVPTDGLLMNCFSQDWLLFIMDVDSADLGIAIARKCCFVCSTVYSWSSGDKTAIFFRLKKRQTKNWRRFLNPKWWCWNDRLIDWQINDRLLNKWMLTGKLTTELQGYKSLFDSHKKNRGLKITAVADLATFAVTIE